MSKAPLQVKLVNSLTEVLIVRRIRNECRTYLTNHTGYISIPQQIYWYFTYYRKAVRNGTYRVYLAKNNSGQALGYGALHLTNKQLLITECIQYKYRGQGWGKAILKKLMTIGKREKLPLTAEIWATNKISIALYTKYGFILDRTMIKSGSKLYIYKKDQ